MTNVNAPLNPHWKQTTSESSKERGRKLEERRIKGRLDNIFSLRYARGSSGTSVRLRS